MGAWPTTSSRSAESWVRRTLQGRDPARCRVHQQRPGRQRVDQPGRADLAQRRRDLVEPSRDGIEITEARGEAQQQGHLLVRHRRGGLTHRGDRRPRVPAVQPGAPAAVGGVGEPAQVQRDGQPQPVRRPAAAVHDRGGQRDELVDVGVRRRRVRPQQFQQVPGVRQTVDQLGARPRQVHVDRGPLHRHRRLHRLGARRVGHRPVQGLGPADVPGLKDRGHLERRCPRRTHRAAPPPAGRPAPSASPSSSGRSRTRPTRRRGRHGSC